jgi:hypothetical protein
VVDVCAIPSAAIYVTSTLDTLGKTEINSKARRYVLPLSNSGAKVRIYMGRQQLQIGRSELILACLGFKLNNSEGYQSICNTAR